MYQNEENFEICTFYIAKITNLGQQLGQSINFHNYYTKMRLRNILSFWKWEPQYAYKRYAYVKTCSVLLFCWFSFQVPGDLRAHTGRIRNLTDIVLICKINRVVN